MSKNQYVAFFASLHEEKFTGLLLVIKILS